MSRWGRQAAFWAALVVPGTGVVVVGDDELVAPRHPRPLVVRGEGLWAELVEETPGEHWSVGLEAFGVRLDDPLDAVHGERGERLPLGFDLEWETRRDGFGEVHGDLLVAKDRLGFDGLGHFEHGPVPERDPTGETWRLVWLGAPDEGRVVPGDELQVDTDGRGLPTVVRVGPRTFTVRGVVVRPDGRHLRALVVGDAGFGWLERSAPGIGSPAAA